MNNNDMTVQELLDVLNTVEDKTRYVAVQQIHEDTFHWVTATKVTVDAVTKDILIEVYQ